MLCKSCANVLRAYTGWSEPVPGRVYTRCGPPPFHGTPGKRVGGTPPLPVGKPPHSNTPFPQFPRCSGVLPFRLCLGLRLGLAAGWNNAL